MSLYVRPFRRSQGRVQLRWRPPGTASLGALVLLIGLGLPSTGLAQEQQEDSITVIERGTGGLEGWDILEAPFWVITFPLYLLGAGLEGLSGVAERGHWIPWLVYYNQQLNDRGIYPALGGQGPNSGTGGSVLLGVPGTERSFWAFLKGGGSVKNYWRAQARVGYGALDVEQAEGPAFGVGAFGSAEHRPEDEFFGIGRESREEDRSDFQLDRYEVGGELAFIPARHLGLAVNGGWMRRQAEAGQDDRLPDVDSTFAPAEIPGFDEEQDYFFVGASAAWRVGFPHALERGGRWASVGYRWNQSDTDGAADFGRFRASAGIDLPFDHRIRSLYLAISYESLRPDGDGEVAFYRLPALGGATNLPSYRADRFRDRDLILGQAEYRYRLWDDSRGRSALDASFFLYGGMVARRLSSEFRFDRLQESYGFALSLLTEASRLAHLALALGGERTTIRLTFGLGL